MQPESNRNSTSYTRLRGKAAYTWKAILGGILGGAIVAGVMYSGIHQLAKNRVDEEGTNSNTPYSVPVTSPAPLSLDKLVITNSSSPQEIIAERKLENYVPEPAPPTANSDIYVAKPIKKNTPPAKKLKAKPTTTNDSVKTNTIPQEIPSPIYAVEIKPYQNFTSGSRYTGKDSIQVANAEPHRVKPSQTELAKDSWWATYSKYTEKTGGSDTPEGSLRNAWKSLIGVRNAGAAIALASHTKEYRQFTSDDLTLKAPARELKQSGLEEVVRLSGKGIAKGEDPISIALAYPTQGFVNQPIDIAFKTPNLILAGLANNETEPVKGLYVGAVGAVKSFLEAPINALSSLKIPVINKPKNAFLRIPRNALQFIHNVLTGNGLANMEPKAMTGQAKLKSTFMRNAEDAVSLGLIGWGLSDILSSTTPAHNHVTGGDTGGFGGKGNGLPSPGTVIPGEIPGFGGF